MKTSYQLGLTYCNCCGECCRQSSCHLEQQDVSRIAQHLGLSRRDFSRHYLTIYRVSETEVAVKPRMTPTGCVFLSDGGCSINDVKPKGGRDFECWTAQPGPKRYWWKTSALGRIGIKVVGGSR